MEHEIVIVWSTFPELAQAEKTAGILVEEGLAACVHLFPAGQSIYRWQGTLHRDTEYLLMIKTRAALYAVLEARLRDLHPYEVPEILAVPVSQGSVDYLAWVYENTMG